jgi:hypothetical protein
MATVSSNSEEEGTQHYSAREERRKNVVHKVRKIILRGIFRELGSKASEYIRDVMPDGFIEQAQYFHGSAISTLFEVWEKIQNLIDMGSNLLL